jgi:hypothetical protein
MPFTGILVAWVLNFSGTESLAVVQENKIISRHSGAIYLFDATELVFTIALLVVKFFFIVIIYRNTLVAHKTVG